MIDSKEGNRTDSDLMASVGNDFNWDAFKCHDLTEPIEFKFWDDPSRTKF